MGLHHLPALPGHPRGRVKPRIIVLTGYPSDENIKKAKQKGANRCLAKPVDTKVLLKEVSQLMGAAAAGEQN